jgi:hypothetical protein
VGSSAVRESRSFPTGLEGIIKEGELFLVAWSPGAIVRASEAARRHWSEQNKEPGVSLPQDAHFSNKVDIWDSNDRFEADDSTQMAENAYCLPKIHNTLKGRGMFLYYRQVS